ncbi:uncharacterized protein LOC142784762 [Rhipicephalus microplus]|uniref:uncharacterized protein LOC142784762 n=1 Tax=Rhipicephalus microplus TaxID=6941 RepID=UPI003F6B439B
MYVYVERKTWDAILSYVTFAYNTTVQEAMQMTPYKLVYARSPATILDAIVPNVSDGVNIDVTVYLPHTKKVRQLARLRIKNQQSSDAMTTLNIGQSVKLAVLACAILASLELIKTGPSTRQNVVLYTLMDIAYMSSKSIVRIYLAEKSIVLMCSTFMAFGNFVLCGFAYLPRSEHSSKQAKQQDMDGYSPFSNVILRVAYKHFRNTLFRSKVVTEDIPRLTLRARCTLNRESECEKFVKQTQSSSSPCSFYCLVLKHAWKELYWSNSLTLLFYSSLLLRIPLFVGLLDSTSIFSFDQSVILLCASCIAECFVSNLQSYFTVQGQLRAQLLLQTAVFKKVTCQSATALAENPAGHVTSLLAADCWLVASSFSFLPNTFMGFVCAPIALGLLGTRIGSVPVFACLLWLLVIAGASFSLEPLLHKYYNKLYRYRDELLKKLSDFLSVLRLVKMSALEDVFRSKLLHLPLKEIDQAYHVNVVDSLLETVISASTSVMTILAFATVTFINPEKIYSPATIYSCMYTLSLMDVFTSTLTHAVRLKSPVFRSCRRLMSFFADEEWNADATKTLQCTQASNSSVDRIF